ncbi:unnamed protein product [Lymnaea stagnalis]|uniref:Protein N-terminal glutamine amidohydrolase n=1 Tax=Lymnaea stagnalis TaxID=6523 RepID=A0AAV2HX14_LYMST
MTMSAEKATEVIHGPDTCTYTPCYCEENVWKLCERIQQRCSEAELSKCSCVFISNNERKIPLWHQKASKSADRCVIWDYHVILLYHDTPVTLVYDLDTELSFPCPLKEYAAACIGSESTFKQEYKRLMFRVVPAQDYLTTFASDRSHMISTKGEWLSPPPDYPPIKSTGSSNNIDEFISMDSSTNHGMVLTLQQFLNKFQVYL